MVYSDKEYQVKTDVFEGPLDLLLYLIQKSEVPITEIVVSEITRQYLSYLEFFKELNIEIAAEYLSMAATLIRLKSREMMPTSAENEETDKENDNGIVTREQLIQQLLEYRKFKEAANSLKAFESQQFGSYPRGFSEQIEQPEPDGSRILGTISLFDLVTALKRVLQQTPPADDPALCLFREVKVDDRIEYILGVLSETQTALFDDLFNDDNRRIVVVATFMALLELIRMQRVVFHQETRFGAIYVSLHRNDGKEGRTKTDTSNQPVQHSHPPVPTN